MKRVLSVLIMLGVSVAGVSPAQSTDEHPQSDIPIPTENDRPLTREELDALELPSDIDKAGLDGSFSTPAAIMARRSADEFDAIVDGIMAARSGYGFGTDEAELRTYLMSETGAAAYGSSDVLSMPGEGTVLEKLLTAITQNSLNVAELESKPGFVRAFNDNLTGILTVAAVEGSEAFIAAQAYADVVPSAVSASELAAIEAKDSDLFARLSVQGDGNLAYNPTRDGRSIDTIGTLLEEILGRRLLQTVVATDDAILLPDDFIDTYCRKRHYCGEPRAGSGIINVFGPELYACSLGFPVRKSSAYDLGYLTAEHCVAHPGETWTSGYGQAANHSSSFVLSNQIDDPLDAVIVDMNNLAVTTGIYLNTGTQTSRDFTGSAAPSMSLRVCMAGRKSLYERCGFVEGVSGTTVQVDIDSGAAPIDEGDSGGPVYLEANKGIAIGIVSQKSVNGGHYTFHPITNIMNEFSTWGLYTETWETRTGTQNHLYALYDVAFSRDPDAGGWNYWFNRWNTQTECDANLPGDSAWFVGHSPELIATYPINGQTVGTATANSVQRVKRLYRSLLGRDADYGGQTYWVDYIMAAKATICCSVVEAMTRSSAMLVRTYSEVELVTMCCPAAVMLTRCEAVVAKTRAMVAVVLMLVSAPRQRQAADTRFAY